MQSACTAPFFSLSLFSHLGTFLPEGDVLGFSHFAWARKSQVTINIRIALVSGQRVDFQMLSLGSETLHTTSEELGDILKVVSQTHTPENLDSCRWGVNQPC